MSANIEYNKEKGTHSFVSAKEPAWHCRGTILDHVFTAEEAIEHANLGYEVEKHPIFTSVKKGENEVIKRIPDKYATVRTDNNNPLGIVGSKYEVLQNKEAFKFFDTIVGEGKAIYETAGVLGRGEKIFITAKLPEKLVVAPNDAIDQYLFITNSHDGSGSISAAFTTVRIVCTNTLAMALNKSSHKVKFRHTISAKDNLSQAAKMMGIAVNQGKEMEQSFQAMTKVKITDKELKKFIQMAIKPQIEQISEEEFSTRFNNMIDEVITYAHNDETQLMESTKGTLYGALNAITGYYSNVKDYKSDDIKLNNLMWGTANKNSNRAYNLAIDVLGNQITLS